MPFTFSHPAIVLPAVLLPRGWYSLTGLVAGSMVPDFEYFLRMSVYSKHSHTVNGLILFNLPLAIVLCFVFHLVVRDPLIKNLPNFLHRRLIAFNTFDWITAWKSKWPVIIVSILLGASSHLLWDAFTHQTGFFVKRWPAMNHMLSLGNISLPLFKFAQHGSTIAGAMLIILFLHRLPSSDSSGNMRHKMYWPMIAVITIVCLAFRLFWGPPTISFGSVIVGLITSFMIGLITTPTLIKFAFATKL